MLELLFKQEAALQRHQTSPLFDERMRYLTQLHQQGTSLNRLRTVAAMLLNITASLEMSSVRPTEKAEIERASKRWAGQSAKQPTRCDEGLSTAFIQTASHWLRFHGVLIPEKIEPPPFGDLLPEYLRFLAGPKGMTPATVNGNKSRAWMFLRWAATKYGSFTSVTQDDVDEYLDQLHRRGMKPGAILSVCQTLKSLFKFCEAKGITRSLVSASIAGPSTPRYNPENKGPRWRDVQRMIVPALERTTASIRADAILCLFALYGLRSVEVSSLLMSDVDMEERVLTIRRAKGGRAQRFPLHSAAGSALADYLALARPVCGCTNFFVTLRPPYRKTTHASLRCIVANRMRSLRIKSILKSTHALRHSCATELLNQGISMSEIARYLGHKGCGSVGVYAKCSKALIRAVADFPLEGIS